MIPPDFSYEFWTSPIQPQFLAQLLPPAQFFHPLQGGLVLLWTLPKPDHSGSSPGRSLVRGAFGGGSQVEAGPYSQSLLLMPLLNLPSQHGKVEECFLSWGKRLSRACLLHSPKSCPWPCHRVCGEPRGRWDWSRRGEVGDGFTGEPSLGGGEAAPHVCAGYVAATPPATTC